MKKRSSKRVQKYLLPTYGYIVNIFYQFSPEENAYYATQNQHGSRFERIDISEIDSLKIISELDEMNNRDMFDQE